MLTSLEEFERNWNQYDPWNKSSYLEAEINKALGKLNRSQKASVILAIAQDPSSVRNGVDFWHKLHQAIEQAEEQQMFTKRGEEAAEFFK